MALVSLVASVLHITVAVLNLFDEELFAMNMIFMFPFYLAIFSSILVLTFPYFIFASSIFTIIYLAAYFYFRDHYLSFHGDATRAGAARNITGPYLILWMLASFGISVITSRRLERWNRLGKIREIRFNCAQSVCATRCAL